MWYYRCQQQSLNGLLVEEKVTTVGGNTVPSGVTYWEMEAGDTGCEIYKRLKRIPQAVGIYSYGRYMLWRLSDQPAPYRGGEHHRPRAETTSTHCAITRPEACGKIDSSHWHRVPFEPEIDAQVMEKMLEETGH